MSDNFFKISKGINVKGNASAPANPEAGDIYYNSTDNAFKIYDGTSWKEMTLNDAVQALTNKDIDGGTASNTSRLTVPKDTKANLDALTRKEGTILWASDESKFYIDDGSTLVEVGGGAGDLLSTNNLSDVANAATALSNLSGLDATNIVPQAEAEAGTATTARTWTAERVKQAIDALGGGGGGGGSTLNALIGGGTITNNPEVLGTPINNGVSTFTAPSLADPANDFADIKLAQPFFATNSNIYAASSTEFAVDQLSVGSGNTIRARVWDDNAGNPGNIIAVSTNTILSESLSPGNSAPFNHPEVTFFFSGESLTPSSKYYVSIEYESHDGSSENVRWAAGNQVPAGSYERFQGAFGFPANDWQGGSTGSCQLSTVEVIGAPAQLSFTEDLFVQVPGMENNRNRIPVSASPISFSEDEIVSVTYNSTDPGTATDIDGSIDKSLPGAFTPSTDQFIVFRAIGKDLYLGDSLNKLEPGESTTIGHPTSSLSTYMGSSETSDKSPSYSSENYISNGDDLTASIGKLDTASGTLSTNIENQRKLYGQAELVGNFTTTPSVSAILAAQDVGQGAVGNLQIDGPNERLVCGFSFPFSATLTNNQVAFRCVTLAGNPNCDIVIDVVEILTHGFSPVFSAPLYTSNPVAATSFPPIGSPALRTWTFPSTVSFDANKDYAFMFRPINVVLLNSSNDLRWNIQNINNAIATDFPYTIPNDFPRGPTYVSSNGTSWSRVTSPMITDFDIDVEAVDITNTETGYVFIPGVAPERNEISAGTTTLLTGQVAYLPSLNTTGTGAVDQRPSIIVEGISDHEPALEDFVLFKHNIYENSVNTQNTNELFSHARFYRSTPFTINGTSNQKIEWDATQFNKGSAFSLSAGTVTVNRACDVTINWEVSTDISPGNTTARVFVNRGSGDIAEYVSARDFFSAGGQWSLMHRYTLTDLNPGDTFYVTMNETNGSTVDVLAAEDISYMEVEVKPKIVVL